MSSAERRLFITTDADGNLKLGGNWAIAEIKGDGTVAAATVTQTTSKIVNANAGRKALMIYNNSPTDAIYIGFDVGVSVTTGWPVPPGAVFVDYMTDGDWYAVAGSGVNVNVRIMEATLS